MTPRRTPSERILVVLGMQGLGDAVEALPVFELIKRHKPGAVLDAGYFRPPLDTVLATSPHVGRIVQLRGNAQDPRKSLPQLAHNVRAMRGHSAVLFLYKRETIAWPWHLAAWLAGARLLHRHGYRYRDVRRNVMSDFPQHVFFQLVASNLLLGKPLANALPPRLDPPPEALGYAAALWERLGLGDRPVVLMNSRAPGYEEMGRWGLGRFARLAEELQDWGADVLVNGGGRGQDDEYERLPPEQREAMTMISGHSLLELAAVMARCALFVGEPSGPTHLARAVGTPTLSLQGPGDRRYPGQDRLGAVWWPQDPAHPRLSKVEWCQRTCGDACGCRFTEPNHRFKHALKRVGVWDTWKGVRKKVRPKRRRRWTEPPAHFPCLEAISPEEAAAAAIALLEREAEPARVAVGAAGR